MSVLFTSHSICCCWRWLAKDWLSQMFSFSLCVLCQWYPRDDGKLLGHVTSEETPRGLHLFILGVDWYSLLQTLCKDVSSLKLQWQGKQSLWALALCVWGARLPGRWGWWGLMGRLILLWVVGKWLVVWAALFDVRLCPTWCKNMSYFFSVNMFFFLLSTCF